VSKGGGVRGFGCGDDLGNLVAGQSFGALESAGDGSVRGVYALGALRAAREGREAQARRTSLA
jgi:hypothetical protein